MLFKRFFMMAVVVSLAWISLSLAASSLAGSRWRVEITPQGETVPHFVDQIRFQREVFGSAVFERRGFPSAAYTQIPGSGNAVEWEAKQQSDSEGSLAWTAEFKENTMKGSLVWRKPDGKVVKYSLV